MKTTLKIFLEKYYYKNTIIHFLIFPFKAIYDIYRFHIIPDSVFLASHFKKIHGKELNLKNPLTLSEKIQWLKLNERRKILEDCADKFKVRAYVRDCIGEEYLIPLIYESKNPGAICPEILPDFPVIIKTNHNSGGNIIVHDKNQVNFIEIQKRLRILLKENFYYTTKEWQYKNIERRIIVEKLLIDEDGSLPMDYKFHCFNGKVEFIQLDVDRFTNHKRDFYDINWQLLSFSWCPHKDGKAIWEYSDRKLKAPSKLHEMILISEKLSKKFIYSRIDLYFYKEKVYFGEITFHHGSGNEIFNPLKYDKIFGQRLNILK